MTFDLLVWLSYFILDKFICRLDWLVSEAPSLYWLLLWNLVDPMNRLEFCKIGWISLSNFTFDLGLKWFRYPPKIFWNYFLVCFEPDISWLYYWILDSFKLILCAPRDRASFASSQLLSIRYCIFLLLRKLFWQTAPRLEPWAPTPLSRIPWFYWLL